MKTMKKAVVAALTAGALALSLGAMAGCSSPANDEQVIRESLAAELDQLKNADEEAMTMLVQAAEEGLSASDSAQLESMGITTQNIVESMIDGFDYTIDSVTVNGNAAVATVDVTAKDFGEFMTGITNVVSEMMDDPSQYASMTEEQIMTAVGDKIKEVLANLPMTDSTIDLDLVKNGSTWEATEGAGATLGSVFFGA